MIFGRKHEKPPDLDSPDITALHARIIKSNAFLRLWYRRQYEKYGELSGGCIQGTHIEIGSGGGFLREICPGVKTSSLLKEDVQKGYAGFILDAARMDLADNSVDSFFLLNVLHHLPDPESFFSEAFRTIKKGGFVFCVEPANTLCGRLLYKSFHHENFDEKTPDWRMEMSGHLSGANQALAHIIFERDIAVFKSKFPGFSVQLRGKHTFLSYLVSGGLTYKPFLPAALAPVISKTDDILSPLMPLLGLHMDVLIKKL